MDSIVYCLVIQADLSMCFSLNLQFEITDHHV